MIFTPVFEQGKNGWIVAQIKEWPAVISQGKTLVHAKGNLLDALYAMIQSELKDKMKKARFV